VMGYDNTEASEFCSPPLSTVHYAADEVSNIAVDRMIELIKTNDTDSEPIVQRISPDVIVRSTT
ncbi:MAG: substrate-binding domain-containing protein, partial [Alphaproteobacteria bacterium]